MSLVLNGNAPAFSAYQSSTQTLSSNVTTKITFTTENYDTNSNYDTSTSRFTPTVAGYYQISTGIQANASATAGNMEIWKNGARFKRLVNLSGNGATFSGSCMVDLNGSTDYVEIYAIFVTGQALTTGSEYTYFQGVLVRGV